MKSIKEKSVLSIENASFSYDGKTEIFSGLNGEINTGEVFGILGPNGIGKSTLLKSMMNLQPLKSGDIKIDGRSIKSIPRSEMAKLIAFIPQAVQFTFPYKVLDVVLMGRTPYLNSMARASDQDYEKAVSAIEMMGITEIMYKPCTQLSGGQLQLVMLARALAQEARFLLLDEPTNHLDYGKQMKILHVISSLKKMGTCVIMTTHNPDHAFWVCDKVAIMNRGFFTSVGSPDQVITKENLKEIYQIDVDIITYEGIRGRNICVPDPSEWV